MKDLFDMYKPRDIVYPSAVSRHYHINMTDAYKMCDAKESLIRMYLIRCPHCNKIALSERFYSMTDFPSEEIGCEHCDELFTINPLMDATVCYEHK